MLLIIFTRRLKRRGGIIASISLFKWGKVLFLHPFPTVMPPLSEDVIDQAFIISPFRVLVEGN